MTQTDTRSVTFASGDLSLEGALHLPGQTPAPGVVVCHPHPQYGGDMDNNVVVAACEALAARGFAALRFNFRGTGGSDGAFDQGKGEQEDARAALKYIASLPEVDSTRLSLAGYSFGAVVVAEVAGAHLRAIALISPPLNYADLRVSWGCPALLLGSDQDPLAPAARLRLVADAPGVELHLASGADHSWWGYEGELGAVLAEFFERHSS